MLDLDALERGCDELDSRASDSASVTFSAPPGFRYGYKPGVMLSVPNARALIAELRASRKVVEAVGVVMLAAGREAYAVMGPPTQYTFPADLFDVLRQAWVELVNVKGDSDGS